MVHIPKDSDAAAGKASQKRRKPFCVSINAIRFDQRYDASFFGILSERLQRSSDYRIIDVRRGLRIFISQDADIGSP